MNLLGLGAGRMGLGDVHDLARQPDVDRVTVADVNAERANLVASRVRSDKVVPIHLDVTDHHAVVRLMGEQASVLSCVVYKLNVQLAQAAVEAGTNFCDLGGNDSVVHAEPVLDPQALVRGR